MKWEDINKKINEDMKVGIQVPKTDGSYRLVTKIEGNKIQLRTGQITNAKKYVTKEMIKFAYDIIIPGDTFTSEKLKMNFPREYNQGSCVFSMTGGILELLGIAICIPNPSGRGYAYILKKSP